MRTALLAIAAALGLGSMPLHAQEAPPPADGIRTESTVVVEGEQPGPGLWLVRNGEHDLYILGTVSPLPAKMQWQSRQVEQVIADAQEVIYSPSVSLDVKVGFFKGLTLLPSLYGMRKNPDGKRLQQMVSPGSYARWQALKARYIGSDGGIEYWRPLFAAQELYKEAQKKTGLARTKSVGEVITKAIDTHHPQVTRATVKIAVTDPKPLIKEFSRSTLDDTACFDNTMTLIESDLDKMRARANAWATGDLATLQALPVANNYQVCMEALSEAGIGRKLGFRDAQKQADAKWMAAVDAALEKNAVTFAVLDMQEMLGPNGYLARLKAKGYTVIAPDEE